MPYYDYLCNDCGAVLEVKATLAQKEAGLDIACPACGSKQLQQSFRPVAVSVGAFKGASSAAMQGCENHVRSGGGCHHGGSCGCH